jgi:hypothetical protein
VGKILVNCDEMHGELSTPYRYLLGALVAAYVLKSRVRPTLAFVGKPPTIDGFAVRVSQENGLIAEVFSNQEDALNWLENVPE